MSKLGMLPADSCSKWKHLKSGKRSRYRCSNSSPDFNDTSIIKLEPPFNGPHVSKSTMDNDTEDFLKSERLQLFQIDKKPINFEHEKHESDEMIDFCGPRPVLYIQTPLADFCDESKSEGRQDEKDSENQIADLNKSNVRIFRFKRKNVSNEKILSVREKAAQIVHSTETKTLLETSGARIISETSNKSFTVGKGLADLNPSSLFVMQSRMLSGKDTNVPIDITKEQINNKQQINTQESELQPRTGTYKPTENVTNVTKSEETGETIPIVHPKKFLYTVPYSKVDSEKSGKSKLFLRKKKHPISSREPRLAKPIPILQAQEIFYATAKKQPRQLKAEVIDNENQNTNMEIKYHKPVLLSTKLNEVTDPSTASNNDMKPEISRKLDHSKEAMMLPYDAPKPPYKHISVKNSATYFNKNSPVCPGTIKLETSDIDEQRRTTCEPIRNVNKSNIFHIMSSNHKKLPNQRTLKENKRNEPTDSQIGIRFYDEHIDRKNEQYLIPFKKPSTEVITLDDDVKKPVTALTMDIKPSVCLNNGEHAKLVSDIIRILKKRNALYEKMESENKNRQSPARKIGKNIVKTNSKISKEIQDSENQLRRILTQLEETLERGHLIAGSRSFNSDVTEQTRTPKSLVELERQSITPSKDYHIKPRQIVSLKSQGQHGWNKKQSNISRTRLMESKPYQRRITSRSIYKPMITLDNTAEKNIAPVIKTPNAQEHDTDRTQITEDNKVADVKSTQLQKKYAPINECGTAFEYFGEPTLADALAADGTEPIGHLTRVVESKDNMTVANVKSTHLQRNGSPMNEFGIASEYFGETTLADAMATDDTDPVGHLTGVIESIPHENIQLSNDHGYELSKSPENDTKTTVLDTHANSNLHIAEDGIPQRVVPPISTIDSVSKYEVEPIYSTNLPESGLNLEHNAKKHTKQNTKSAEGSNALQSVTGIEPDLFTKHNIISESEATMQNLLDKIYQTIISENQVGQKMKSDKEKEPVTMEQNTLQARENCEGTKQSNEVKQTEPESPGILKQFQNTLYAFANPEHKRNKHFMRRIDRKQSIKDKRNKPGSSKSGDQMQTRCVVSPIDGSRNTTTKFQGNEDGHPSATIFPEIQPIEQLSLSELLRQVRERNQYEIQRECLKEYENHMLMSKVTPKCPGAPCAPKKPPPDPCPLKPPCPRKCPPPFCPPPVCDPAPKRPPCANPCGPCKSPPPCPPQPCTCPPPKPLPPKCPPPPGCPPCRRPKCPGSPCAPPYPQKPPFRKPRVPPPLCPSRKTPRLPSRKPNPPAPCGGDPPCPPCGPPPPCRRPVPPRPPCPCPPPKCPPPCEPAPPATCPKAMPCPKALPSPFPPPCPTPTPCPCDSPPPKPPCGDPCKKS